MRGACLEHVERRVTVQEDSYGDGLQRGGRARVRRVTLAHTGLQQQLQIVEERAVARRGVGEPAAAEKSLQARQPLEPLAYLVG